jgi:CHAT domain-containing protein/cytochrome c-type biogenesis protein CcmH/NrfG
MKTLAPALWLGGLAALSVMLLFNTRALSPRENLNREYVQVLHLMGGKKYDEAVAKCKQLIAKQPRYHVVYRKLVDAFKEKKELTQAETYFQTLIHENPHNACAYYGLGLTYREKREHCKALESFQKAVEFSPQFAGVFSSLVVTYGNLKKLDDAIIYLSGLISSNPNYAYAHYGIGYAYRLQQSWEKGLAHLDRALQLNADLIEAIMVEGEINYQRGQYTEATATFARGLRLAERKNDPENKGKILINLGTAYRDLGDYPMALDYLHQAQGIFQKLGDRVGQSPIPYTIGIIYYGRSNYPQALSYLKAARELYREANNRQGAARCVLVMAAVHRRQGNHQEAMAYSEEALKISQDLSDPSGQAEALNSLGNIYVDLGDTIKALDCYERTLKIFQALGNTAKAGESLINIANVQRHFGDQPRALQYLQHALAVHQKGGDRKAEADTLINMANNYEDLEAYNQALEYRQRAFNIFRKLNNLEGEAGVLNDIGFAYERLGNDAKALEYYQQALAMSQKIHARQGEGFALNDIGNLYLRLGELEKAITHQQRALKLGEQLNHPQITWRASDGLARALEKQGQLEEATDLYQKAIAIIEKMRGRLQTSDQRAGYMQSKLEVYENVIGLLLKRHGRDASRGYGLEAFAYAERAHARALLETLGEARLTPQDRHPTELADREPYSLQKVQQQVLDHGEAVLEYLLGKERSYLFLVTKDRFEVIVLPSRSNIERIVKPFLDLLRNDPAKLGLKMDRSVADLYRQGHQLYEMLLGGIRTPLPSRLIIVADGLLHYLPFEALVKDLIDQRSETGGERWESTRYLVEDYNVVYAPSASVLGEVRQKGPARKNGNARGLLALGDPLLHNVEGLERELKPLPYSRAEVDTIAKFYAPDQRRICLGEQATESVVKKEAGRYLTLHFATHGWVDDQTPARSAILLAGDQEEDGRLQMSEIFNLELHADLAVLSACQTGLGKAVRGEGLMSLTRAFLYAGARSVMVSLWNVNDETTAKLMERFYQQRQAVDSKGEALRQAKLAMLRVERLAWRHPYFWAGFVLVGNN